MNIKTLARRFGSVAVGVAVLLSAAAAAQAGGETYKATASVKSPTAAASTPVTIRIQRFVTDAERTAIIKAVQSNDPAATRKALEAVADIGYIEVGSRRTPIKYAYARTTGSGRMITVVTAKPVAYLGSGVPGAKPKGEYELALALLILDAQGAGDGEFSPAVTVKMDDQGAIVTTDYQHEVVRLTGISKVK
jgi:hypothetical protein